MRAWAVAALGACATAASAQIDPEPRLLLQSGVNRAIDGRGPLMGYVYAYLNSPRFMGRPDRTLRLALAPVYADAELGLGRVLGRSTHFGVGLAGGGFADSYGEMRDGAYLRGESFTGHGGKASIGAYHDFPKRGRVPLAGVARAEARHAEYTPSRNTEPGFQLPKPQTDLHGRVGLRFGGQEPVLLRRRWQVLADYGYGINASRSGSGAHALGVRLQIDLAGAAGEFVPPREPQPGLDRLPR